MTTDLGMQMALILRTFEEMEREMADFKAEWKKRRTNLEGHLARIKYEILTGQSTLFSQGENGNGKNGAGENSGELPDQPH